jgi:hypothetical protein
VGKSGYLQVFFTPTIINFAIFMTVTLCALHDALCKKQVKTGILKEHLLPLHTTGW